MLFGILTLLVALSISAIAAYYSIVGLTAIFAAAVFPIILMGGVLEVGKIVTTVWLHQHWKRAPVFTKAYLSSAVVILMFITSMGIFGFLSKSHIQQTAQSTEQVAQIETLDSNIARSQAKIDRWVDEIDRLSTGTNTRVDSLVEKEQQTLNELYVRIDKVKDDARAQAESNIALQNDRIQQAQKRKEDNIAAIELKYQSSFNSSAKSKEIDQEKANEVSVAASAQREIRAIQNRLADELKAIDERFADQIFTITGRIDDLRNQANNKTEDIDGRVNELDSFILAEQRIIDGYREEKSVYETQYRQLEAEVGPIKYIAEFIYGEEADKNLLEAAVRWVIIIIVAVFDPLAIMLVLAATMQLSWIKEEKHGPEAKQKRIEELEMKIEEYNEFLLKLESELDRLTEEGEAKAEQIKELEVAIVDLQKEKADAIAELEELLTTNELKYANIIEELHKDVEQLNNDKKDNDAIIKELTTKIEELENKEPEVVVQEVEKIVEIENEEKIKEAELAAKELEKQIKARDAAMERLNEKYKLVEKANTPSILQAQADDDEEEIPPATFGSSYPENPINGQLFTKTDIFPHALYKYNGKKWIEVDKEGTDSYLTEDYIRLLVEAVAQGETELEDLTDQEKQEMTNYLSNGKA
jgi:myosin heavy subunit